MTYNIKHGTRRLNQSLLFSVALFACSVAGSAQHLPTPRLSPALQAISQRQSLPLPVSFNFAPSALHRVHITDAAWPTDPFINSLNGQYPLQWAPIVTQTYQAWYIWQPKNVRPIVIAVIDTGVDDTHPDLTNMILRDAAGGVVGFTINTKIVNGVAVTTRTLGPTLPDHPHGTHCAGIAAAQSNNGIGIVGMAGWNGDPNVSDTSHVKIMPVKVLDASGDGTDADVAEGMDWAVAHGANILSISLGDTQPSPPIAAAVANAWAAGCMVICAAGNESNTNYFYPAASPYAISVAAYANYVGFALAPWSTRGTWVNLAAPGDHIYSTLPNNTYDFKSGTSMACPHVAGLAAMAWSQNPTLKNADVYSAILRGVDPYASASDEIMPGSGIINSHTTLQAVNAAMGTLTGNVTLEGCANAKQPISLRFRSTDGGMDFTYPATLTAGARADTGVFTLSNLPAATYNVSVKGAKWLQKNAAVTISNAPAASVLTVSLLAGDANNDNSVDPTDFNIFVSAYNTDSKVPGSGYDDRADFNCDGVVDPTDFGLFVSNYNTQGEE